MSQQTIAVPDIGGAEGAEVVELLVAVGDTVELEQSLIVLESDKASMEIPSSVAGKILELKVAVGDALSEGDVICVVEAEDDSASDASSSVNASEDDEPSAARTAEDSEAVAPAAQSASSDSAASSVMTVEIPDIGTDGDVDLVEFAVAVGDEVAEGDSLVVLESDKASMEVPAPQAGKVVSLLVEAGVSVRQGTPIIELEVAASASTDTATPKTPASEESATPAAAAPSATETAVSAKTNTPLPATTESRSGADVYAGPAVRKLAREFGIELTKVKGSGPRGRLLKEDLHSYVKTALQQPESSHEASAGIAPIPEVDFSKFGSVDPQPRSRLDKITAQNMTRSWLNVPHVTQFDDADITDLETFRVSLKAQAEKRGTKLSPLPFILKACAVALNANPKLKSSLADGGDTLVYKQYCHIGMAVDTPSGLVVPVLRDIDQKSIWEISAEVIELASLARDKKLKPDQMQGGVFTVSSLGGIGGRGFTPIVNAPEVAILGVSRASLQPVWTDGEFVPRKMLPLSLSYDHRVVNGGDAGRFLTQLVGLLSDIREILM